MLLLLDRHRGVNAALWLYISQACGRLYMFATTVKSKYICTSSSNLICGGTGAAFLAKMAMKEWWIAPPLPDHDTCSYSGSVSWM